MTLQALVASTIGTGSVPTAGETGFTGTDQETKDDHESSDT